MSSSHEDLLSVLTTGSAIHSHKDRHLTVVVSCGDGLLTASDNNIPGPPLLALSGRDAKKEGPSLDIDPTITPKSRIGHGWLGNSGGTILHIISNIAKENGTALTNGVFIAITGSTCNMNLDSKREICLIPNTGPDPGTRDNWPTSILEPHHLKIMDTSHEHDAFALIPVPDKSTVNTGLTLN